MNKRIKLAVIATPIAALAAGGIIYAMPDKKPTTQLSTQTPTTTQVETAPVETQPVATQTAQPAPTTVEPAPTPTPPVPKTREELKAITTQVVTATWKMPSDRTEGQQTYDNLQSQIDCVDRLMTIRFNWNLTEEQLRANIDKLRQKYDGYYCSVWLSPGLVIRPNKPIPGLF